MQCSHTMDAGVWAPYTMSFYPAMGYVASVRGMLSNAAEVMTLSRTAATKARAESFFSKVWPFYVNFTHGQNE